MIKGFRARSRFESEEESEARLRAEAEEREASRQEARKRYEERKAVRSTPVERSNRDRASLQEKVSASRYGGRVKPGSGSSALSKGDVQTRAFLIEMKQTIHGSISVKGEWLEKITNEARGEGRLPALEIKLKVSDPLCESEWVLVPSSVFAEFNEELSR